MLRPPMMLRATLPLAAVALLLYGCQLPEGFSFEDGSVALPDGGDGTGGEQVGTGGGLGTGGILSTGGAVGSGGRVASGGITGVAGSGNGGRGGGGATGGSATGGSAAGGAAASGGTGGAASGGASSGGMMGSGGRSGSGGGIVASGGAGGRLGGNGGSSSGGRAGSGTGSGGSGTGSGGRGAAGSTGAAGVVGTNPCAGLCTSPIVFTTKTYSSGNLGTAATCHETTVSIQGGNCSNLTTRTFKVNDVAVSTSGNWATVPAKRNGGYCFEASAGTPDFASFVTF